MASPQNGQSAARNARLAQGAAVVLLGAVGVLGAVGIPGMQSPPRPPDLKVSEVEIKVPHGSGVVAQPADYATLTNRMSLLENAPKLPDAPAGDGGESAPPPPPPPPAPVVKYLGPARVGTLVLALVSDGGKQRFVKSGDRLSDDSKVKQVLDGAIVVEKDGGESRIELSVREGALTTSGVAGPPGGGTAGVLAATGGRVGVPRAPGQPLQPASSLPGAFIRSGFEKGGQYFDSRGNPVTDPQQIHLFQIRQKVKNSGQFKSEDDIDGAAKKLFEQEQAPKQSNGKEQGQK